MTQQKINIILDDPQIPDIQRENDFHIMDHIILHAEQYTISTYKQKFLQIRYCCKYYQVTTMSDMTNAAGTNLDPFKFKGIIFPTSSFTNLHMFNQERPNNIALEAF